MGRVQSVALSSRSCKRSASSAWTSLCLPRIGRQQKQTKTPTACCRRLTGKENLMNKNARLQPSAVRDGRSARKRKSWKSPRTTRSELTNLLCISNRSIVKQCSVLTLLLSVAQHLSHKLPDPLIVASRIYF